MDIEKARREEMLARALAIAEELKLFDRPPDVVADEPIDDVGDEDVKRMFYANRASYRFKPRPKA